MPNSKNSLRVPFFSALLGGAIVAVFGLIAISSGLVKSDGGSSSTAAAPVTAPIVSKSDGESANVVNQIYKNDGGGVAFIESQVPATETQSLSPFGEPESEGGGTATGSGFVIDSEGHILTNNHVVEGADKIEVKLGESNTNYTAEVVGADPASDLALLKVDAPANELHPLTLGDSSKMEVGDPVGAIGNPFGLDRTVTSGIVSALQRQIQAPNGFSIDNVIQTDAAINPGNSGGPLINAAGEVIGINSQIETGGNGSEGNVGIGFAIPIDTAKEEMQRLEQGGATQSGGETQAGGPFLGISGASITPELAQAFNLPVSEGVLIQQVLEGGPAAAAGIQGATTAATIEGTEFGLGGDIVTAIDGQPVATIEALVEAIDAGRPGDTIELTIVRGEQTATASVTLGEQPGSGEGGLPE